MSIFFFVLFKMTVLYWRTQWRARLTTQIFIKTEERSRFLCSDGQSSLTLWDSMNSSLPGSSVHGIFQARLLEWVATSYSRGYSKPKDWTLVSCVADEFFTAEPLGKSLIFLPTVWKGSLHLLHCQEDYLPLHHLGGPSTSLTKGR